MQRSSAQHISNRHSQRPVDRLEPAIESLKNQLLIKPISPRLVAAKAKLVSILWGFKSDRRYKSITLNLTEQATRVLDQISRLIETAEETPELIQNIKQLEQTLRDIDIFVHLESQSDGAYPRLFAEDISDRYFVLDHELFSLLNTFEKSIGQQGYLELSSVNHENSGAFRLSSGIFSHARGVTVKGGQFYNIQGNFSTGQSGIRDLGQVTKTIIQTLRVVPTEDVSMRQEIMSRQEYRLYSAHMFGRAIAIKLYDGRRAKQTCLEAAKWNRKVMHPSILHMIGSSSADSDLSFLVFDGDYEGVAESCITTALEGGLKQSLTLGIETVIGLSSGLDYLERLDYSFEDVRLEHFIVLVNREGKIKISFDPEEAKYDEQSYGYNHENSKNTSLNIFHGLCQRTFDAARQGHYKGQIFQLEYPDLLDDDQLGLPNGISDVVIGAHKGNARSNPSTRTPSTTEPQIPYMQCSRHELVWKSQSTQNVSLNTVSRQFQAFLIASNTSSKPRLHRYRGRYPKQTAHRCPGYSRVEITLTADITQSAIVSHSTPTAQEICPICNEVVADEEIFNCMCGREDDESMPTVRCPSCSKWHHRSCLMTSELQGGLCGRFNDFNDDMENFAVTASLTALKGAPAVPTITWRYNYRQVSNIHYAEFARYLAHPVSYKFHSNFRARSKLSRLENGVFFEISTDLYEELMRRNYQNEVPFLPVIEEFHPERNLARQKMATIPTSRFKDLLGDFQFELARRYPELHSSTVNTVGS